MDSTIFGQAQALAKQHGLTVTRGSGESLIVDVNGQQKTFTSYDEFERYINSLSGSQQWEGSKTQTPAS